MAKKAQEGTLYISQCLEDCGDNIAPASLNSETR